MAKPILPDNSTTEQSRRRRFNRSERAALYWVADGRCEECGVPLDDGFHADHVFAFSKGGETDVTNGRALCAACNLKKGAR